MAEIYNSSVAKSKDWKPIVPSSSSPSNEVKQPVKTITVTPCVKEVKETSADEQLSKPKFGKM